MFPLKKAYPIPKEELEELRMISNLDPEEICRLKDVFVRLVGGENGTLHKDAFLAIDFIENNPLSTIYLLNILQEWHQSELLPSFKRLFFS